MSEVSKKDDKLLETTDCLEAVGTLRNIKNGFFLIIFLCLVILQGIFWLVPTEYVSRSDKVAQTGFAPVTAMLLKLSSPAEQTEQAVKVEVQSKAKQIEEAAQALTSDANKAETGYKPTMAIHPNWIKIEFKYLSGFIVVCNYLLVISAVLYSLTLLFAMNVSLVGRLGGISHITRATFLSFAVIVLILPWQILFKGLWFGVIYTPAELLQAWQDFGSADFSEVSRMIFRFVVWWLIAMMFLLISFWRSMRWSRNTLKRLGVVG
ncbi:MAG: hypothetical protein JW806_10240 [Sedimentisphaerales bacterium]|nr:hypothetical protein [Sedimentisphaerales bacterium]